MNDAFQVGPLLLPAPLLIVMASVAVASIIAHLIGRRRGVEAESLVWQGLLVAAIAARLAFVIGQASSYREAPWSALDIRDGGWQPAAGLVAGVAYLLWRVRGSPARRIPVVLALAGGLAVYGAGQAWRAWPTADPPVLAALPLSGLDGSPTDLAAFAGKPTVVNLWATWCPPCQREMPVFERAQRERGDVNFVFISQGETAAQVAQWLRRQRLALDNVLIDPSALASTHYRQRGYPTSLFFAADGRLVTVRVGELSAATLAAHLARIRTGDAQHGGE